MRTLPRLLGKMRAFGARLRGDERGSVLIMLVFGLITLVVAAGASIDFGNLMVARSRAQLASDSVVLFATGTARQMLIDSQGNNTSAILADVRARAQAMMHVQDAPGSTPVSATLTLERVGQKINAQIDFGVQTRSMFVKLVGLDTLRATGTAVSLSTLPLYIDIHVAIDVSQSMGLPATQAGMLALYEATAPNNCVFGCHVLVDSTKTKSNEEIAHDNGILLRTDVMRSATKQMIQDAIDYEGGQARYRFGVYRIHETTLDTVNLTSNLNFAYTEVDKVDLGDNNVRGFGDTNLTHALDYIKPRITSNGNGTDQATAKAFLFIVTDGIQDLCQDSHCVRLIDPAQCQVYKDAGITVGVVYTTYLPVLARPDIPGSTDLRSEYIWLIKDIADQIAPSLKACASPGWYFEATDGAAIQAAMKKLFEQTTRQPVLIR